MSAALCPLAAHFEPPTGAGDTGQCCECNQPAEHKCAMCRELLCSDHARACEFCEASQMPAIRFCDVHALEVEDRMYICEEHMPDFDAEMKRVMADELAYEEVMA